MALLEGPPDRREEDAALAAFGLAREADAAPPEFGVWPENRAAVEFFLSSATQWRVGPNGRTGLDYAALMAVLPLYEVRPRRQRRLFAQLQVLEIETLEWHARRRERSA